MKEQKAMKAYKSLRGMESAADLKKAKFTLYDYHEACECLREYARNNGEDGTATISEAVARWYKKQGFEVTKQGENGIGWDIR